MQRPRSTSALARILAATLAMAVPGVALAASSWEPTLLVNTESFQTIDSGNGTSNRELRFGDTTTETLFYDVTNARFTFTRDLRVQGNIVATGALVVKKAISGASLVIDSNASFAHSGVTISDIGAAVFNENSNDADFRVEGNGDANLVFGDASTDRVGIGTATPDSKLEVIGTMSGTVVRAQDTLASSGTLVFEGAASGSSLYLGTSLNGAGLSDCDNASNSKLLWDATTGRFSCGTDNSGSSFTQGAADERYVRKAGDTMTGALTIDVAGENTLALSVSGAFVFNESGLNNDARFEGDTDQNLMFVDASTDRVGIGTATPKTKLDVIGTLSGAALRVSGAAEVHGPLAVTGAIRTDSNLTINDDQTAADAILTFGQPSTNETLTFSNSRGWYIFSDDVSVLGTMSGSALWVDGNSTMRGSLAASGSIRTEGNLSGATLTVDGALTLRGQTYNAPTSQTANGFLRTDGAGNLSWTTSLGNGSGNLISLHPEYSGAVYFQSGSTYVGQLTLSGGTTALDNSYVWTSTQGALQDYWISVRFRVPDNFSTWDAVAPIQLRYKTGVASNANNHVTVRLRDTAGALVTLTNGGALANTSWTTAAITGPQSSGTWTPKGYGTVYVKLAANSTAGANAAAGFLNLNFETTNP